MERGQPGLIAARPMVDQGIPLPIQQVKEAIDLSAEIMRTVELGVTPLSSVVLEARRLAQGVGDAEYEKIMEYEAEGYPTPRGGMPPEAWRLATLAGRAYEREDPLTGRPKHYTYVHSIGELEKELQQCEADLAAAMDPSTASYTPNPDRLSYIRQFIQQVASRLGGRRKLIYHYALRQYYQLRHIPMTEDEITQAVRRASRGVQRLMPRHAQSVEDLYHRAFAEDAAGPARAVTDCRLLLQGLWESNVLAPAPTDRTESEGTPPSATAGHRFQVGRLFTFLQVFGWSQANPDVMMSPKEAQSYLVAASLLLGDILLA